MDEQCPPLFASLVPDDTEEKFKTGLVPLENMTTVTEEPSELCNVTAVTEQIPSGENVTVVEEEPSLPSSITAVTEQMPSGENITANRAEPSLSSNATAITEQGSFNFFSMRDPLENFKSVKKLEGIKSDVHSILKHLEDFTTELSKEAGEYHANQSKLDSGILVTENSQLKTEKELLVVENKELKQKIEILTTDFETLKTEVDNLKNALSISPDKMNERFIKVQTECAGWKNKYQNMENLLDQTLDNNQRINKENDNYKTILQRQSTCLEDTFQDCLSSLSDNNFKNVQTNDERSPAKDDTDSVATVVDELEKKGQQQCRQESDSTNQDSGSKDDSDSDKDFYNQLDNELEASLANSIY